MNKTIYTPKDTRLLQQAATPNMMLGYQEGQTPYTYVIT